MSAPQQYNVEQASGTESKMQAYDSFLADLNRDLCTEQRDCDLCEHRTGGLDLVVHMHYVHKLEYSAICPCQSCVLKYFECYFNEDFKGEGGQARLKALVAGITQEEIDNYENWSPVAVPSIESHSSVDERVSPPLTQVTDDYVVLVDDTTSDNTDVAHVPGEHANIRADTPLSNATNEATASKLHSDTAVSDTSINKNQYLQLPTPPSNHFAHERQDISTASIPQTKGKLAASAFEATPRQPAVGDPLPNRIVFWPGDGEVRENNLPYEMSQIEYGELQQAAGGGVAWNIKDLQPPPHWIAGNDKQLTSVLTGKGMSWLPLLPFKISRDVPGWQLLYWFRATAAQGHKLKQQDIFDRMADPLTGSGLSNRMQCWQRGIGLLPQQHLMMFNWPSKQSMEAIAQLNYFQLRFNTWWEVCTMPCLKNSNKQIYVVRQPKDHAGYRDWNEPPPSGKPHSAPHYVIEDPEYRQMSEQVKLLDDAMLFLTIKAEECGMPDGFSGIMNWISEPAGDKWTSNLDVDLVLEFQRWREGCPDTPSVSVLRSALEQAGPGAESEAIMNADYSLTPRLQQIVGGLASLREKRRLSDGETRAKITSKVQKRKRKASDVDGAVTGDGNSKRQAIVVRGL